MKNATKTKGYIEGLKTPTKMPAGPRPASGTIQPPPPVAQQIKSHIGVGVPGR